MTLNQWKAKSEKTWYIIARELTDTMNEFGCREVLYLNRLNRLRRGVNPTPEEIRALLTLTKNQVDSYT